MMKEMLKSKLMIMFVVIILGLIFANGIGEKMAQKNVVGDTTTINNLTK